MTDLYRCEYIKYFPGLGKDEKLFKYKWLFKILLLMLDSFPKSAELNQGRRNPPALNYIKGTLIPNLLHQGQWRFQSAPDPERC